MIITYSINLIFLISLAMHEILFLYSKFFCIFHFIFSCLIRNLLYLCVFFYIHKNLKGAFILGCVSTLQNSKYILHLQGII